MLVIAPLVLASLFGVAALLWFYLHPDTTGDTPPPPAPEPARVSREAKTKPEGQGGSKSPLRKEKVIDVDIPKVEIGKRTDEPIPVQGEKKKPEPVPSPNPVQGEKKKPEPVPSPIPEPIAPKPVRPVRPVSPFERIDSHALAASPDVEGSVKTLAKYLAAPAKNDTEKVRAIYRWITDRIAYDVQGLLTMNPGDLSPAGVLRRRECVCEGYARLFEALAREVGVEAIRVVGRAKNLSRELGQSRRTESHAWNAVKVGGKWSLLDATWGAGGVNGTKYTKCLNNFYFLSPPEQLIFTHYPTDGRWQLLPTRVSLREFQSWGRVNNGIFQLGISAEAVRKTFLETSNSDLVEVFSSPPTDLALRASPLKGRLKAGETVRIRVDSEIADSIAFVQNGEIVPFTRQGTAFEGEIIAKPGTLLVSVRAPGTNTYWGVLKYDVKE
jgi:transglutaminase-like putative cysteine protease